MLIIDAYVNNDMKQNRRSNEIAYDEEDKDTITWI